MKKDDEDDEPAVVREPKEDEVPRDRSDLRNMEMPAPNGHG
jgi:hypothetical protein